MEDKEIIQYFLDRNEDAINELQIKYGAYCFRIADNILCNHEDAEECINDTWGIAWNTIPPNIPASLKAFLGKVVRNQALLKYRANHAKKRYNGLELVLEELGDMIPSGSDPTKEADSKLLAEAINAWLGRLKRTDREMFVRRYYMCESVKSIAEQYGISQNKLAQKMLRLRTDLKRFLSERGF